MNTLALRFKTVFLREKNHRLDQALDDMRQAAVVVLLSVLTALLFFILLAIFQNHTFPWLPLLNLVDELLFIVAVLTTPCILLNLSRYFSWRLLLNAMSLLTKHFRRAGKLPPAAEATPILLLTRQMKQTQRQIAAFWRQLRQRLAIHPPDLWPTGNSPLLLFQQAVLLLAP